MSVKTKPRFLLFVLLLLFVSHRTCFSIVGPASSKLELLSDGNLVLLKNFTETVWSTALASSVPNTSKAEAVILDDGNFVDRSNNSHGRKNGGGFFIGPNQETKLVFMVCVGLLESFKEIHRALVNA
ncbi:hypothetical protein POTOM_018390 [Populus tomentosa]|uniref:Bulb-type lectin domain-containing protein n=1 Tax=Populus tomentosa TaxID=118781 RepID=A0A8X7ZVE4_POPTO|nr:hypothetical protein POTOM_018390 [Populus tomentosa]